MGDFGITNNFNATAVLPRCQNAEPQLRLFPKGSGNKTTWTPVPYGANDRRIINETATFYANSICFNDPKTKVFDLSMAKAREQNLAVNQRAYEEEARMAKRRRENNSIIPNIIKQEAAKLSIEERKAVWSKLENAVDETTAKMLREALGITTQASSKSLFSTLFK